MKYSLFVLSFIGLLSCQQSERSKIEVIKLDSNKLKEIISACGLPTIDTPRNKDFYYIEHYTNKMDGSRVKILKDSLQDIVGIVQERKQADGVDVFDGEYYTNGQIKGKHTVRNGTYNGSASFYYEDGRIRSICNFKDGAFEGKCQEYDRDGVPIVSERE